MDSRVPPHQPPFMDSVSKLRASSTLTWDVPPSHGVAAVGVVGMAHNTAASSSSVAAAAPWMHVASHPSPSNQNNPLNASTRRGVDRRKSVVLIHDDASGEGETSPSGAVSANSAVAAMLAPMEPPHASTSASAPHHVGFSPPSSHTSHHIRNEVSQVSPTATPMDSGLRPANLYFGNETAGRSPNLDGLAPMLPLAEPRMPRSLLLANNPFRHLCGQRDNAFRDWNEEFQGLWETECRPIWNLENHRKLQELCRDFDDNAKSLVESLHTYGAEGDARYGASQASSSHQEASSSLLGGPAHDNAASGSKRRQSGSVRPNAQPQPPSLGGPPRPTAAAAVVSPAVKHRVIHQVKNFNGCYRCGNLLIRLWPDPRIGTLVQRSLGALMELRVPQLCFPLSSTFRWCGSVVSVQALVPISHESRVLYRGDGASDASVARTVHHQIVRILEALNLTPMDRGNQWKQIGLEVIQGSDSRYYITSALGLLPPLVPSLAHPSPVFRFEYLTATDEPLHYMMGCSAMKRHMVDNVERVCVMLPDLLGRNEAGDAALGGVGGKGGPSSGNAHHSGGGATGVRGMRRVVEMMHSLGLNVCLLGRLLTSWVCQENISDLVEDDAEMHATVTKTLCVEVLARAMKQVLVRKMREDNVPLTMDQVGLYLNRAVGALLVHNITPAAAPAAPPISRQPTPLPSTPNDDEAPQLQLPPPASLHPLGSLTDAPPAAGAAATAAIVTTPTLHLLPAPQPHQQQQQQRGKAVASNATVIGASVTSESISTRPAGHAASRLDDLLLPMLAEHFQISEPAVLEAIRRTYHDSAAAVAIVKRLRELLSVTLHRGVVVGITCRPDSRNYSDILSVANELRISQLIMQETADDSRTEEALVSYILPRRAAIHCRLGAIDKALSILRKIASRRSRAGSRNILYFDALIDVALVAIRTGDEEAADALFQRVYEGYEKTGGILLYASGAIRDIETLGLTRLRIQLQLYWGHFKLMQERYREARKRFQDALDMTRKMPADSLPSSMLIQCLQGLLHVASHSPVTMDLVALQPQIAHPVMRMRPFQPSYELLLALGRALFEGGFLEVASETLRDCMELARAVFGSTSDAMAAVMNQLAFVYYKWDLGLYHGVVLSLLEDASLIVRSVHGAYSVSHLTALQNMIRVWVELGLFTKASALLHRLLSHPHKGVAHHHPVYLSLVACREELIKRFRVHAVLILQRTWRSFKSKLELQVILVHHVTALQAVGRGFLSRRRIMEGKPLDLAAAAAMGPSRYWSRIVAGGTNDLVTESSIPTLSRSLAVTGAAFSAARDGNPYALGFSRPLLLASAAGIDSNVKDWNAEFQHLYDDVKTTMEPKEYYAIVKRRSAFLDSFRIAVYRMVQTIEDTPSRIQRVPPGSTTTFRIDNVVITRWPSDAATPYAQLEAFQRVQQAGFPGITAPLLEVVLSDSEYLYVAQALIPLPRSGNEFLRHEDLRPVVLARRAMTHAVFLDSLIDQIACVGPTPTSILSAFEISQGSPKPQQIPTDDFAKFEFGTIGTAAVDALRGVEALRCDDERWYVTNALGLLGESLWDLEDFDGNPKSRDDVAKLLPDARFSVFEVFRNLLLSNRRLAAVNGVDETIVRTQKRLKESGAPENRRQTEHVLGSFLKGVVLEGCGRLPDAAFAYRTAALALEERGEVIGGARVTEMWWLSGRALFAAANYADAAAMYARSYLCAVKHRGHRRMCRTVLRSMAALLQTYLRVSEDGSSSSPSSTGLPPLENTVSRDTMIRWVTTVRPSEPAWNTAQFAARWYDERAQFDDAILFATHAVHMARSLFSDASINYARALDYLATLHARRSQVADDGTKKDDAVKSLHLLQESLAVLQRAAPDSTDLGLMLSRVGQQMTYRSGGSESLAVAAQYLQQATALLAIRLPHDHAEMIALRKCTKALEGKQRGKAMRMIKKFVRGWVAARRAEAALRDSDPAAYRVWASVRFHRLASRLFAREAHERVLCVEEEDQRRYEWERDLDREVVRARRAAMRRVTGPIVSVALTEHIHLASEALLFREHAMRALRTLWCWSTFVAPVVSYALRMHELTSRHWLALHYRGVQKLRAARLTDREATMRFIIFVHSYIPSLQKILIAAEVSGRHVLVREAVQSKVAIGKGFADGANRILGLTAALEKQMAYIASLESARADIESVSEVAQRHALNLDELVCRATDLEHAWIVALEHTARAQLKRECKAAYKLASSVSSSGSSAKRDSTWSSVGSPAQTHADTSMRLRMHPFESSSLSFPADASLSAHRTGVGVSSLLASSGNLIGNPSPPSTAGAASSRHAGPPMMHHSPHGPSEDPPTTSSMPHVLWGSDGGAPQNAPSLQQQHTTATTTTTRRTSLSVDVHGGGVASFVSTPVQEPLSGLIRHPLRSSLDVPSAGLMLPLARAPMNGEAPLSSRGRRTPRRFGVPAVTSGGSTPVVDITVGMSGGGNAAVFDSDQVLGYGPLHSLPLTYVKPSMAVASFSDASHVPTSESSHSGGVVGESSGEQQLMTTKRSSFGSSIVTGASLSAAFVPMSNTLVQSLPKPASKQRSLDEVTLPFVDDRHHVVGAARPAVGAATPSPLSPPQIGSVTIVIDPPRTPMPSPAVTNLPHTNDDAATPRGSQSMHQLLDSYGGDPPAANTSTIAASSDGAEDEEGVLDDISDGSTNSSSTMQQQAMHLLPVDDGPLFKTLQTASLHDMVAHKAAAAAAIARLVRHQDAPTPASEEPTADPMLVSYGSLGPSPKHSEGGGPGGASLSMWMNRSSGSISGSNSPSSHRHVSASIKPHAQVFSAITIITDSEAASRQALMANEAACRSVLLAALQHSYADVLSARLVAESSTAGGANTTEGEAGAMIAPLTRLRTGKVKKKKGAVHASSKPAVSPSRVVANRTPGTPSRRKQNAKAMSTMFSPSAAAPAVATALQPVPPSAPQSASRRHTRSGSTRRGDADHVGVPPTVSAWVEATAEEITPALTGKKRRKRVAQLIEDCDERTTALLSEERIARAGILARIRAALQAAGACFGPPPTTSSSTHVAHLFTTSTPSPYRAAMTLKPPPQPMTAPRRLQPSPRSSATIVMAAAQRALETRKSASS